MQSSCSCCRISRKGPIGQTSRRLEIRAWILGVCTLVQVDLMSEVNASGSRATRGLSQRLPLHLLHRSPLAAGCMSSCTAYNPPRPPNPSSRHRSKSRADTLQRPPMHSSLSSLLHAESATARAVVAVRERYRTASKR